MEASKETQQKKESLKQSSSFAQSVCEVTDLTNDDVMWTKAMSELQQANAGITEWALGQSVSSSERQVSAG